MVLKTTTDINEDIFDNRIIILKRVKSLKQLRRTEKELVRLNYKEAVIKGFTLKGIQQYIATKTKIWIEWSCLGFPEEGGGAGKQGMVSWSKDHFAYIRVHRKCIDGIGQLKKEMWNMAKRDLLILKHYPSFSEFKNRISGYFRIKRFNMDMRNYSLRDV